MHKHIQQRQNSQFLKVVSAILFFCRAPNSSTFSVLDLSFTLQNQQKLQDNRNNVNRNTNLGYFAVSKLRNKPKRFLKCYQIFFLLSGDISLILG